MKGRVSPKRAGSLTKVGVKQLFVSLHFHDIEGYLILNETGSYFAVIDHQLQVPKQWPINRHDWPNFAFSPSKLFCFYRKYYSFFLLSNWKKVCQRYLEDIRKSKNNIKECFRSLLLIIQSLLSVQFISNSTDYFFID